MENLDLACAQLGADLAAIQGLDEKFLTSALSVLEEQGLYAFFLYLGARGENQGREISNRCHRLLTDRPAGSPVLTGNQGDVLKHVRSALASDLDGLLLARDLLRQALIYARYHAKAPETPGGSR